MGRALGMGRDCAPLRRVELPTSLPVESRQTHGWWGPMERPPAGKARWQELQQPLQPLIPACSPSAKVERASPAWAMRPPSAACCLCGTPEFLGKTFRSPRVEAAAWVAGDACGMGMPVRSGSDGTKPCGCAFVVRRCPQHQGQGMRDCSTRKRECSPLQGRNARRSGNAVERGLRAGKGGAWPESCSELTGFPLFLYWRNG